MVGGSLSLEILAHNTVDTSYPHKMADSNLEVLILRKGPIDTEFDCRAALNLHKFAYNIIIINNIHILHITW